MRFLVHAERGQRFGLFARRLSYCQGLEDFGMFDFDGLNLAVQGHGEEIVLESFGAIQVPGVVGERLGALRKILFYWLPRWGRWISAHFRD